MSRHTDIHAFAAPAPSPYDLPMIHWASVQHAAPTPVAIGEREPDDPLPAADVVIVTWTSAEWSALDHVFVNSGTPRPSKDIGWQKDWALYSRNIGALKTGKGGPPWGFFRLVDVPTSHHHKHRVLLFKADVHLAHDPWITALRAMTATILGDVKPKAFLSVGTAGGARLDQRLGDVVVTNSAYLAASLKDNKSDPGNDKKYTCKTWYPSLDFGPQAKRLMLALDSVVTKAELEAARVAAIAKALKYDPPIPDYLGTYTTDDLTNDTLLPTKTRASEIHSMKDIPLNTSDDFGIAPATGIDPYSAYEEDDAVLASEADKQKVAYAFVRNISDTVVPSQTRLGQPIPNEMRSRWGGAVYDRYGLLTSMNGALATWAVVAGSLPAT